MIYTTYNPTTGQIYSTISSSDSTLPESTDTIGILPGQYNAKQHRVVNGSVQDLPADPSDEKLKYRFDYATGTWQIDIEISSILTRIVRNNLLTAVDRINPVWFNSLTTQQQTELAEYRQALLDVPQQSGFPTQVNWPAKPTWI
jgi:hypothetical protein